MTPHLVEWRHDRVGSADLEFQSGNCHFGSSPRHLLGRIQSEPPTVSTHIVHGRRRPTLVLPEFLFQDYWLGIVGGTLLQGCYFTKYQRSAIGAYLGNYLKSVVGRDRRPFRRHQTPLGKRPWEATSPVERLCPKVIVGEHLCLEYGRRELTSYIRKETQSKRTSVHDPAIATIRCK